MSFWYVEPKDNNKHALIGTKEWSSCNVKIHFDESIAKEDDNYWYLFMNIQEIKPGTIYKYNDKNWEFKPQLCLLRFAKKEIERKGEKIPQSNPEKFFCQSLSELEPDKHYSGFIHIQESPQMLCLVNGAGTIGDMKFPEEYLKAFKDSFFNLVPTEARTIDDNIMQSIGNKSGYGGYKKAETELEKINARLEFIKEQFRIAFVTQRIDSLYDIHTLMQSDEINNTLIAKEVWKLAVELIGK